MRRRKVQPMQPIVWATDGVIRFQDNAIVRAVLDAAREGRKYNLNDIAIHPDFCVEDREQFNQLIGYSVSGFGELSQMRRETIATADAIADAMSRKSRRTPKAPNE